MYSFVLRAHQKVDRVAYKHLALIIGSDLKIPFSILELLNYEGPNGPDATRLKKGKSEPPWHFYQPGAKNPEFLKTITEHHRRLVKEIVSSNHEHAAFEAAWLAHALVDGLTPAHHYPYEAELEAIRRSDKDTRSGIGSHFFIHADTARESIKRSFKLIGPKGLLTAHTSFDAGASTIILSLNLSKALPDSSDIIQLNQTSFIAVFERYAKQIEQLKMYERFIRRGWTQALARDMRREVAPRMVRCVTLAWYSALSEAALKKGLSNAGN